MYNDDPVQVYPNEVCQAPPLTREQEMECVRHIRAADLDLIQTGNQALLTPDLPR
jgi:hypothetical protein